MDSNTYIKEKIQPMISQYQKKSKVYANTHMILTIIGISLCVTSPALLAIQILNIGIFIACISCSVVAACVLLVDKLYDFEAKAVKFNYQAKLLEKEKTCFLMKTGIYSTENTSEFVSRCESIINM